MKFTRWMGLTALTLAVSVTAWCPAVLADTLLADWEVAPNPGGATHVGEDFDPQLDTTISCSGCWYSVTSASGVTYSQSTGAGATTGTHALQATIVGKGAGGQYSPTINGAPFELDTHFDYPLRVTYSNTTNPAAGGPDPRFTAIQAAVDGNQGLFTIDFDITYDVAQMRSIPWQPPEQTNPPPQPDSAPFDYANRYPQRFFWIGMYGNSSAGPFTFTGYDENTISPFAAKWDTDLLPVFHASFPLADFGFVGGAGQTNFTFGFLYNSVFGTLPTSGNTTGLHIYFDNFRLVERDVVGPIDFNDNMMADLGDFDLFMAQHLVATPTLGDFDMDGDNDFLDFQQFEEFYDLATGGAGSLRAALAGIPEPGTLALAGLGLAGLFLSRGRRLPRKLMTLAIGIVLVFTQQSAQAQIIEDFETVPTHWVPNPGAVPISNPTVALGTVGVTHGSKSLKVTQAFDTTGDNDFVWNAIVTPNWTTGDTAYDVLRNAVNIGAEHFNLLVDTTFDPLDTYEQAVNSLTVTLGLSFNGQTAGVYAGESELFTTTTTIPLSAFDLLDVEDQGATSYSAQIGFTADALQFPFAAYIDNIRLEQISTPDLLTLEINRADGSATLKNLTTNPISWDRMEIKSTGGRLDPAGWSSLDDQNADGANTWIEAGGSSATALVEQSLLGSHTLMPTETMSLGNLYNNPLNVNARDLVDLEIRRAAGPSFRTYDQLVTYVGVAPPSPVAGDYNNNGLVDAADYTLWRDHLGANFQLLNEGGISPGTVNQADYDFWKSRFGATSGSGSGGVAANSVPEPATLVLCALLAVCTCRCTRRD